jgi:hypothetical protein
MKQELQNGYYIETIEQENGRFAVVLFSPEGEIIQRHWVGTAEEAEVDVKAIANSARNIIACYEEVKKRL